MLFVPPDIRIDESELRFTFVRSSGPGGQNVNKVNSKAVLRFSIEQSPGVPEGVRGRFINRFGNRLTEAGELVVTSQRHRDQRRNADDCIAKLEEMLAAVARPPRRRKKTRPTRASVERRKEQKRARSKTKSNRRWRGED
jgi:ribosome-associated protein